MTSKESPPRWILYTVFRCFCSGFFWNWLIQDLEAVGTSNRYTNTTAFEPVIFGFPSARYNLFETITFLISFAFCSSYKLIISGVLLLGILLSPSCQVRLVSSDLVAVAVSGRDQRHNNSIAHACVKHKQLVSHFRSTSLHSCQQGHSAPVPFERSYLLASFHGDTAGCLTLPLLRALFSCAAKRFPRYGTVKRTVKRGDIMSDIAI